MKQKIILLLVLIAGLTACTKDDDDYISMDAGYHAETATVEESKNQGTGVYEGEWIVGLFDKQVVDTAKLTVTEKSFKVRLPEEYLLQNNRPIGSTLYVVDKNGNPVNKPDNPYGNYMYNIEYEPSNLVLEYVNRGYSSDSKYVELSINSDSYKSEGYPILGSIHYINKFAEEDSSVSRDLTFIIGFSNNISGVAKYDQTTGLWTIKLKLDIIAYDTISNEELHFNPIELVYIAKKKI